MKTVGDYDFVIQVWLEQKQASARTGATASRDGYRKLTRLFFRDSVIFSYGEHYPMARIDGKIVWRNSGRSTVTTESHKRQVKGAAERAGFTVLDVADIYKPDVQAEFAQRVEAIGLALRRAFRARNSLTYSPLWDIRRAVNEAQRFAQATGQEFRYQFDKADLHKLRHRVKLYRDKAQAKRLAERMRAA